MMPEMMPVEAEIQARFEQVEESYHRIEESHRKLEHVFTEYMSQAKQISLQHSNMITRFDNILSGDTPTSGILVRMDRIEQGNATLNRRLDEIVIQMGKIAGRWPVPVSLMFSLLSASVVGLLVALVR